VKDGCQYLECRLRVCVDHQHGERGSASSVDAKVPEWHGPTDVRSLG
jgi:hypothetical protein